MSGAREPITPFIVKLPALAAQRGVSCVLVIGGSGQYFDVAGQFWGLSNGRLRRTGPACGCSCLVTYPALR